MLICNDIAFSERSDLYIEHLELCCTELLLPKTKPIIDHQISLTLLNILKMFY